MYIICYIDAETRKTAWERVSGEDVMLIRVDELFNAGVPISEIIVFDENCEIGHASLNDESTEANNEIRRILETLENSTALTGYKIMDGRSDSLIIRDAQNDTDYEITVTECC